MEGNQQKMRETLLAVRDALDTISAHECDIEFVRAWIKQTKEAVQEALSAPARQCDVGTAEEKYQRWVHFCEQRLHSCHNCECNSLVGCTFKFGDMPYIKEGGEA